jgi:hypothetical protein
MSKWKLFLVSIFLIGCVDDERKCLESSKVKSIDSINYRSGVIVLENGMKIDVYQPSHQITAGYNYCID